MDRTRDGVSSLSGPAGPTTGLIDLHLHSTASDGEYPPEEVMARAARAGLAAVALTDHDTLDGVPAALAAGLRLGLRVIGGCEFSVGVPWGEMHLLGYFLSPAIPSIETYLTNARELRASRGQAMVERLQVLGIEIDLADLTREAKGGAIGRPHVARALVSRGAASGLNDAFDRYLGRGKPAFVDKVLPPFAEVAQLVHSAGGVVSAAHLKERGSRSVLRRLKEQGLDAVETRHPGHDPDLRARLTEHAIALGLLRTGGSDWHGDGGGDGIYAALGSQQVPGEWLDRLEAARPAGPLPEPR
jgi:predicted metal-dependent phosphoesterase TrpH